MSLYSYLILSNNVNANSFEFYSSCDNLLNIAQHLDPISFSKNYFGIN